MYYFQVVWKNSKEIGAAWAIKKDNTAIVLIKYKPGANYYGQFGKNVFPPTAALLGPEWPHVPPKFTRCPIGVYYGTVMNLNKVVNFNTCRTSWVVAFMTSSGLLTGELRMC